MSVIAESFPKLLHITTLLYGNSKTVNLRWDDRSWQSIEMEDDLTQDCPLPSIFAALVLNKILAPLNKILQEQEAKQTQWQEPSSRDLDTIDTEGA